MASSTAPSTATSASADEHQPLMLGLQFMRVLQRVGLGLGPAHRQHTPTRQRQRADDGQRISGDDERPGVHSRRHPPQPRLDLGSRKLGPHPHQHDRAEQAGEAEQRQRQRPQQSGAMVEPPVRLDALALVQRAPPQHRIMDDRQVDRADQPEQRRHAAVAAALALGRGQRDVAEIEEEQDQHRGQPPVPFPPGAPGRPAPDRAGREADRGEGRARRARSRARRPRPADGARPIG